MERKKDPVYLYNAHFDKLQADRKAFIPLLGFDNGITEKEFCDVLQVCIDTDTPLTDEQWDRFFGFLDDVPDDAEI